MQPVFQQTAGISEVSYVVRLQSSSHSLADRSFRSERKMILHFPGGGFVAMSPKHHSDYLARWAQTLRVPILSVDYRKAPVSSCTCMASSCLANHQVSCVVVLVSKEHPYPAAFHDCCDVFAELRRTNGRFIGTCRIDLRCSLEDGLNLCQVWNWLILRPNRSAWLLLEVCKHHCGPEAHDSCQILLAETLLLP
jgi:acetyl esterase/lipase